MKFKAPDIDDMTQIPGVQVSKEGRIDLSGAIKQARRSIKEQYPVEKSLAEILRAIPEPKLKPIEEILKAAEGDTLRLDQVFDMSVELQAWEAEKVANQAKRDEALAILDSDIKAIVTETESKLQDRAKQALEKMR